MGRCRVRIKIDNIHLSLLLLLVFGNVVESLPALHHHNEPDHACFQENGAYFSMTEVVHHHDSDIHLVGVRLGDSHDHDACSLCTLVGSALSEQPFRAADYPAIAVTPLLPAPFFARPALAANYSRGPPTHAC